MLFVNKLVGARGLYTARGIEGSGIGAIGDLDSYLRYKSAVALADAAARPSGAGSVLDAAVDLELGTAMIREVRDAASAPRARAEAGENARTAGSL